MLEGQERRPAFLLTSKWDADLSLLEPLASISHLQLTSNCLHGSQSSWPSSLTHYISSQHPPFYCTYTKSHPHNIQCIIALLKVLVKHKREVSSGALSFCLWLKFYTTITLFGGVYGPPQISKNLEGKPRSRRPPDISRLSCHTASSHKAASELTVSHWQRTFQTCPNEIIC